MEVLKTPERSETLKLRMLLVKWMYKVSNFTMFKLKLSNQHKTLACRWYEPLDSPLKSAQRDYRSFHFKNV